MQIGLILLILAFPLLELAVLIKVGQTIGLWWTLLMLVGTGILGGFVVQQQGLAAARRAMQSMQEGRAPIEPVADSLMLMLAGTLLLIPGLISDAAGLVLLVPPLRHAIARWVFTRLFARVDINVETHERYGRRQAGPSPPPGTSHRAPDGGIVIEGEWERIDDPKLGPKLGPKPRNTDGTDKDPRT